MPINMAYNHHHDATVLGKGSRMEKIPYDPSDPAIPAMMRSDPNFVTMAVEHTPSPLGIPTSAHLAAGNGGEYRKSYHGFASSTACSRCPTRSRDSQTATLRVTCPSHRLAQH